MITEPITMNLDPDAARMFRLATDCEREKLQMLMGALLREYGRSDGQSLKDLMDEIADSAQRRGLTPDLLESILKDE